MAEHRERFALGNLPQQTLKGTIGHRSIDHSHFPALVLID